MTAKTAPKTTRKPPAKAKTEPTVVDTAKNVVVEVPVPPDVPPAAVLETTPAVKPDAVNLSAIIETISASPEARTFEIEVPGDVDLAVVKGALEEVAKTPRDQVISLLKEAGEILGLNPVAGGVFARHEIERALVHLS